MALNEHLQRRRRIDRLGKNDWLVGIVPFQLRDNDLWLILFRGMDGTLSSKSN